MYTKIDSDLEFPDGSYYFTLTTNHHKALGSSYNVFDGFVIMLLVLKGDIKIFWMRLSVPLLRIGILSTAVLYFLVGPG